MGVWGTGLGDYGFGCWTKSGLLSYLRVQMGQNGTRLVWEPLTRSGYMGRSQKNLM